jgi:dihydrofolate synthase/folylpolyglutamate synthase
MENSLIFEDFINSKPLYYKEIDHQRVHHAYKMIQSHIRRPLIVHIVGTNGKGSTGRVMATLLHCAGKRVGHFSSPHILKFNERIWIEGEDISDKALDEAHSTLYALLGRDMSESLSYFEYTTLLAFVATQKMDVLVLEAGLGGEFDATNVVKKELSVITPIGLDHQAFLGNTIEEISRTKLNSVEEKALLALQPSSTVYRVADEIAKEKKSVFYRVEIEDYRRLCAESPDMNWAEYLYENATLATKALDILELPYNLNDLKKVKLFGRFYEIAPNVTIDVGHNLLATEALVKAIEKKHKKEKIILVYNALDDKDYEAILRLFKPLIKWVEIIDIDTNRAVKKRDLVNILDKLEIEYRRFEAVKTRNHYLIFGSFYVVEAFLKKTKDSIKNK